MTIAIGSNMVGVHLAHRGDGASQKASGRAAWKRWLRRGLLWLVCLLLLGGGTVPVPDLFDFRVNAVVGQRGFDVVRWELASVPPKVRDWLWPPDAAFTPDQRVALVLAYLDLVRRQEHLAWSLEQSYAQGRGEAADVRSELDRVEREQEKLRPLVEAILARQVEAVVGDLGLTTVGRVWPPVIFRLTTSPLHLTLSPRDVIRVRASRDLQPGVPLAEQVQVEGRLDATLNVSSLIEPTGGYGAYPSMVLETPDLSWTLETAAHEWTHNYLVFHPLGWHYFDSPAMRSINETVADIVGREVGREVLARHYPHLLPPPQGEEAASAPSQSEATEAFEFVREMRMTRVEVDRLLAEGRVEEAEAYMEQRRQVFVEHGYALRKLNQAYFAFHGTYATGPAASPVDPVGQGLPRLRAQVGSLREFVELVRGLRNYEDFQRLMEAQGIPLPP
ncbi:MAG: hypothetical protein ACUVXG_07220 [Anaerolineae bacterium]